MRESKELPVWVRYAETVAFGIAVTVLYCIVKGLFKTEGAAEKLRILCDGFTIPGALLLCFGLLSFLNKEGTFDGLGYSFRSMRRVWQNYRHDEGNVPKTYYDYKQQVGAKRKVRVHMILVGIGFLVVAIVLAIVQNGISNA